MAILEGGAANGKQQLSKGFGVRAQAATPDWSAPLGGCMRQDCTQPLAQAAAQGQALACLSVPSHHLAGCYGQLGAALAGPMQCGCA